MHVEECLHRLVPCKWCNVRNKIDELDAHLLICSNRPVPCPNRCTNCTGEMQYFRPSETTHHRTLCNMELIDCKYAMAGCNIINLRKDMLLHEDDTKVHSSTVFDALQTAQEKHFELELFKVIAQVRIEKQNVLCDHH